MRRSLLLPIALLALGTGGAAHAYMTPGQAFGESATASEQPVPASAASGAARSSGTQEEESWSMQEEPASSRPSDEGGFPRQTAAEDPSREAPVPGEPAAWDRPQDGMQTTGQSPFGDAGAWWAGESSGAQPDPSSWFTAPAAAPESSSRPSTSSLASSASSTGESASLSSGPSASSETAFAEQAPILHVPGVLFIAGGAVALLSLGVGFGVMVRKLSARP